MMSATVDTLRRRLRSEDGWAMVTAMLLMVVMLGSALAVASSVDTQTGQSRVQRNRETAFNLAEAALSQQVVALGRLGSWSTTTSTPACTPAVTDARCPTASQLSRLIPTADVDSTFTWRTDIRDDQGAYASFYDDGLLSSPLSYDANGNQKVWVRATATASGKTRTVVALVRAEDQIEDIPHVGILAGALNLTNNGNKVTVDGGLGGSIEVRCTPVLNGPPCVGYEWKSNENINQLMNRVGQQIQPANVHPTYPNTPALSAETRERLWDKARAANTIYDVARGCPSNLSGEIVWLEPGVTCPQLTGGEFNTAQEPGMLIVSSGTLSFGGNATYHGEIVHLNVDNVATSLVDIGGNACIDGNVLVDGPGIVSIGSSGDGCGGGANLKFNPAAHDAVRSLGSAGVVQNTWRELPR
jgi:Tfp pilus assembly protein PilX